MNKKKFFNIISQKKAIQRMNELGNDRCSFLFIIDYKAENAIVFTKNDLNTKKILFQFEDASNIPDNFLLSERKDLVFEKFPIEKADYVNKFKFVQAEIHKGNSFLTNFTQPTSINTNLSLTDIFNLSKARYKLLLKDWFVVFSPEIFVKINNGKISSYPMKGTIDANLPDAQNTLLNCEKEKAEHATIVDLIRNDLSMVAENVEVKRFRYIEKINTNQTDLLQVSSHIEGTLPLNYKEKIGDIIFKLLPAGSISGAPKPKTLEIIKKAEGYERGFYAGICGYFDGINLESAVMIRFIEQIDNAYIYKSGGGITFLSDAENEYNELIQKIYVPIY